MLLEPVISTAGVTAAYVPNLANRAATVPQLKQGLQQHVCFGHGCPTSDSVTPTQISQHREVAHNLLRGEADQHREALAADALADRPTFKSAMELAYTVARRSAEVTFRPAASAACQAAEAN